MEKSKSPNLDNSPELVHIFLRLDLASLVLFDLDDTLYSEIQYLNAGYSAISEDAAAVSGISAETILDWLQSEFSKAGRKQILQKLCQEFEISSFKIEQWVHILRTVQIPDGLQLKGWAEPILDRCRGKAVILTNGNSRQQENKFNLLGLRNRFPEISLFCAELWEPKPSIAVLSAIQAEFRFAPEDALMIGDSEVDEEFARLAGMEFLHVKFIETAFA